MEETHDGSFDHPPASPRSGLHVGGVARHRRRRGRGEHHLDDLSRTIVSGTPINAPIPFLVGQLALAAVAVSLAPRRTGTVAAALLTLIGTVSLVSGFGDGSFHHALTAPERAIQLGIVAATALTVVFASQQVILALRQRPRPAPRAA